MPSDIAIADANLALLAACARKALGLGAPGEIERLLRADVDWEAFVRLALAHALTPLVNRSLIGLSDGLMPADLRDAFAFNAGDIATRNGRLLDQMLALLDKLAAAGIAAIPYKGPELACRAYGDVALRYFQDIDFIVAQSDVDATLRLLAALGYEETEPSPLHAEAAIRAYAGETQLIDRQTDMVVEPHWAFAPRTLAVTFDMAGIWRRATRRPLGAGTALALSAEDLLVILCVHGSKSQWARFIWTCDVAAHILSCPGLDWPAVERLARAQGCFRMLVLGLGMARRMLALPLPAADRWIAADKVAARLAATTIAELPTRKDIPGITDVSAYRLAMRERWRDRAVYLLRTIATPRDIHYRMVRLPGPLSAFYPLVKIGHDHVALPLWRAARRIGLAGRNR